MAPAHANTFLAHFRLFAFWRGGGLLLLLSLLIWSASPAQQRPVLRPLRYDHFAGQIVLIPASSHPVALQWPRLIARIADHETTTPPRGLLGDLANPADTERVIAWAKSVDYAGAEGVIVALEMIAGREALSQPEADTARQRLDLLRWIRAQRPGLPIYGFISGAAVQSLSRISLELTASGALDYLLIQRDADEANAAGHEQLLTEIKARRLEERVEMLSGDEGAEMLLTARHLHRRFGISPKLLLVYSAALSSAPAPEASDSAPQAAINARAAGLIKAIGAQLLPGRPEAMRRAEVVLFIHTPGTDEAKLLSFLTALARAVELGHRVALLDVSGESASRSRLMTELRRRKLLNQLFAYSASEPDGHGPIAALAQASARFVTGQFLRDDPERLQRAERAQIEMLLNRYLDDWAYALIVKPRLETFAREQLRADPDRLGAATARAEEFAQAELETLGRELFNQHFRRHLHSILLSTGERMAFEARALQRFHLRLPWGRIAEAEIKSGVYLPWTSTEPSTQLAHTTVWELDGREDLDDRLLNRFTAGSWDLFASDVEVVELKIKLDQPGPEGAESYAIRSRRKSKTERRIEINAASARGAFYALAKLEHLGAEGKLREDFQLAEMPAFKLRGIVESFDGPPWPHRDRLDLLRLMGRTRMNRYGYAPKDDPLTGQRWRESYTGPELERFQVLLRAAEDNFVELIYGIRLGSSITYSSAEDLAALRHKLDNLAALGVRHFALFFEDAAAAEPQAEDRAHFSSLAAAHAHLLNRVHAHLRRVWPNSTLSVAPALSAHQERSRDYLQALSAAVPAEISFFWTGVDEAAAEFASARAWSALSGRPWLIWSGFPASESVPWRLHLGAQRGAPALPEAAAGFFASPMSQAHAAMLPLATSADYAWEGRGYDPERAYNRALHLLYDERSRAGVRAWTAAYRAHPGEGDLFQPLFRKQRGVVNVPLLEQRLTEMQAALEHIGIARERGLLRGELAALLALTRDAIARVKSDADYERLPDGAYRLRER
jgi:hypothetical protein